MSSKKRKSKQGLRFFTLYKKNDIIPKTRFAEGMGMFGMAAALLLTRIFAGKVTDRCGEGIFTYSCNGAMFLALILLGLCPNIVTYLLAAILSGFGFGGLEPALQSMAVAIAPLEKRGSANSTFLCAYDIGIGIGGGIAGKLIAGLGYGQMFISMAVFNIVSVIIYILIGRNHPSSFSYRMRNKN